MIRVPAVAMILAISIVAPTFVSAQQQSTPPPALSLCDPRLSLDRQDLEDGDEEELVETRRYDFEVIETLSTRGAVMNAVFEEKWNFETDEPINRFELCSAEPSYVILWSRLLRNTEDAASADAAGYLLDAEGYLRFSKDRTFEFVYAKRPYVGTWELDGTKIVMTADWLNEGQPYSAPVEKIATTVETIDSEGEKNSYVEEMYRIGGFHFFRVPTTQMGAQRECACENLAD